jgi:hypothetical protein
MSKYVQKIQRNLKSFDHFKVTLGSRAEVERNNFKKGKKMNDVEMIIDYGKKGVFSRRGEISSDGLNHIIKNEIITIDGVERVVTLVDFVVNDVGGRFKIHINPRKVLTVKRAMKLRNRGWSYKEAEKEE